MTFLDGGFYSQDLVGDGSVSVSILFTLEGFFSYI